MINAFKQWLSQDNKENGEFYSNKTQNYYINALQKTIAKFDNLNIRQTDLFKYDTLEEFIKVENEIRKHKDFNQVNKESGNGNLSAAMAKYRQFLESKDLKISKGYLGRNAVISRRRSKLIDF